MLLKRNHAKRLFLDKRAVRWGRSFCTAYESEVRSEHKDWEIPRMMDLVLVRHGEAEGNVAFNLSRSGDHSLYSGEFLHRHSSQWRLTDVGRDQAKAAGDYLRNEIANDPSIVFDRYYVSEYLRAQETAARLDLPNALWFSEVFLRERDWGQMDLMSWQERVEKMGSELKRRALDRFLFAPPGGESMADVAFRTNSIISQLHRECADRKVIIVCHGDVMWAMRTRLERMSLRRYRDLSASRRVTDHIHHGQIMWYTRRDPETGKISPFFTHMKSVCPWDLSRSTNTWLKIERAMYTNGMLLATAEQIPRLITHSEKAKALAERQQTASDMSFEGEVDRAKNMSLEDREKLDAASLNLSPADDKVMETRDFDPQVVRRLESGRPLNLRKAIIVEKTPRYEIERDNYNVEGEVLMRELTLRGMNYDNIRRSYEAHLMARENIVRALSNNGIETKIVKAFSLKKEDLNDMDVVFTAGGDGTFLKAAAFTDYGTPIIGVNTDPSMSQGSLCCSRLDMTGDRNPAFERIVKRLIDGKFKWLHHDRLSVKIVNPEGEETILPNLILNEAVFAVRDPAKPTVLDIGIDDLEREKVRCSGIIVCTGTGSTAWYESAARVHPDTVEKVLYEAGVEFNPDIISAVVTGLAKCLNFSPDSGEMGFAVREPIVNDVMGCKRRIGHAKSISIRSLVWNGMVNIDGVAEYNFNFGAQAVLKVGEPQNRLSSVRFDNISGNLGIGKT